MTEIQGQYLPHQVPQQVQNGQPYPGPQDHQYVYPAGDPALTAPSAPQNQIPDFAPARPRPAFKVGGELFEGKVEVPALVMMRFGLRASALKDDDVEGAIQLNTDTIRMMLTKESADRLIARLEDDDNPIGMDAFNKIMPWLMEQYGMRPTEPSSPSSDGSATEGTGTLSTENSQPQA